jgi:ABC-2 type transport system ATP-binding protein
MSSVPFLSVRGLKRRFGSVQAVDGVSFDISAGQVVGLIGANGAGKTTLMRILATLDEPEHGTVHLGGVNVIEQPTVVRRQLGWMPDHVGLYRDTTVGDYLDFYARAHGFRDGELVQRLSDVVEFTELGTLLDRPADALSKGQTQRLSLARTLLNDPEFLILDEPAAGLDPKARLEFKNLVRLLRERRKTLLISSHILSELGEMCDSLLFMDRGRMVHHGDTDSLRRRDAVAAGGFAINIRVHGDPAALVSWLTLHPGWRVVEERRRLRELRSGGARGGIAPAHRRWNRGDGFSPRRAPARRSLRRNAARARAVDRPAATAAGAGRAENELTTDGTDEHG